MPGVSEWVGGAVGRRGGRSVSPDGRIVGGVVRVGFGGPGGRGVRRFRPGSFYFRTLKKRCRPSDVSCCGPARLYMYELLQ